MPERPAGRWSAALTGNHRTRGKSVLLRAAGAVAFSGLLRSPRLRPIQSLWLESPRSPESTQNSGKWLAVAMKKSIGKDRKKLVRDARNAIRACFAISGGGDVLLAAASVVIRITTF